MLTKREIKQAQQWRKGIGRKGLTLESGNNVKLGKKQKHMTANERYDYLVKGK